MRPPPGNGRFNRPGTPLRELHGPQGGTMGHGPTQPINPFAPGGHQPQAAPHLAPGYSGLQGIIDLLTHGINQSQMTHIGEGFNGANGVVGGANGAFAGLSPYAMHFLGTSGLLTKTDNSVPTTDASGNPLTGSALLMANLQNMLGNEAPATYHLASGITAADLAQLFGGAGGIGGHSAYNTGYGANGAAGA